MITLPPLDEDFARDLLNAARRDAVAHSMAYGLSAEAKASWTKFAGRVRDLITALPQSKAARKAERDVNWDRTVEALFPVNVDQIDLEEAIAEMADPLGDVLG